MTKSLIFVTRPIPNAGILALEAEGYEVRMHPHDAIISRSALLQGVFGCDALLSLLTDKIDAEVMEAAGPKLKIIANYAVGFDNVDLEEARKRHITVTNTPAPEAVEAVAEHTFGLLLALAHRIPEADAFTRSGNYTGWSPNLLLGVDVHHKTLGIIGSGRIGSAVAERAVKGFHMSCVYSDIKRDTAFEKTYDAQFLSFDSLLETTDFISLHVPLLPATRHLISTEAFSLMKKGAFLINTSRGPVVDEKALLRALKTERIAGAALDVYECEPSIDCDLTDRLELRNFPNVILTPHTASATNEARQAMSLLAANNIIAVLSGKEPITSA